MYINYRILHYRGDFVTDNSCKDSIINDIIIIAIGYRSIDPIFSCCKKYKQDFFYKGLCWKIPKCYTNIFDVLCCVTQLKLKCHKWRTHIGIKLVLAYRIHYNIRTYVQYERRKANVILSNFVIFKHTLINLTISYLA